MRNLGCTLLLRIAVLMCKKKGEANAPPFLIQDGLRQAETTTRGTSIEIIVICVDFATGVDRRKPVV